MKNGVAEAPEHPAIDGSATEVSVETAQIAEGAVHVGAGELAADAQEGTARVEELESAIANATARLSLAQARTRSNGRCDGGEGHGDRSTRAREVREAQGGEASKAGQTGQTVETPQAGETGEAKAHASRIRQAADAGRQGADHRARPAVPPRLAPYLTRHSARAAATPPQRLSA